MLSHPSRLTDEHKLALLLGRGGVIRGRTKGERRGSSLDLAKAILKDEGLVGLVAKLTAKEFDFARYGIGPCSGSRLTAGVELMHRWRRGFEGEGESNIATDDAVELQKTIFRQIDEVSDAGLCAAILGEWGRPDIESARSLVAALGSPHELVSTLGLGRFETFGKAGHFRLHLLGTDLRFGAATILRLIATVEMARYYRDKMDPNVRPLKAGDLGLESRLLVELLSPESPVEMKLRAQMMETLRSHPALAGDFARLDVLAGDAGAENYFRAVELSQLFELLCSSSWAHPAEIVGGQIPYDGLLAIAGARIERCTRPPSRIIEVKELLQLARVGVPLGPIEKFVDELAGLDLSAAAAQKAIGEIGRRYFDRVANLPQAAAA